MSVLERNKSGESQTSIANDLGVSSFAVWSIVHGRKWKDVYAAWLRIDEGVNP